jgi:tetratricopeptide (TPR) repeat protein
MQRKIVVAACAILLALVLVYANYFLTGFHFTEFAMVRDNPAIRSLSNFPQYFTDFSTASANPSEYRFQPLVTTFFAVEYFLGRGAWPVVFRIGSFLLFVVGLAAIAWLFRSIFERASPHPWNSYLALLGMSLVAFHPAAAELLNPITKSGELLAVVGVILGLAIYAGLPEKRKLFLYLLPPFLGILANPAALVFGPMLLVYMILAEPTAAEQPRGTEKSAETGGTAGGAKRIRIRRRKYPLLRDLKTQLQRFLPALLFTACGAALHARVTPFETSGETVVHYWFTQPYVAWRYFRSFFLPLHFAPISDLSVFPGYDTRALLGIGFVLLLISIALIVAISRLWRPAILGICWFLVGILPGAVFVQPSVESDTRMFLPFLGIAMALTWMGRMLLPSGEPLRRLEAIAAGFLIVFFGYQTHVRNQVWSADESLWRDAAAKSPQSAAAMENYGLALAARGRTKEAYDCLEKALSIAANPAEVEAYLGKLSYELNLPDEPEQHFRRSLLNGGAAMSLVHFELGSWFEKRGLRDNAIDSYTWASSLARTDMRPRYALMRLYKSGGNWGELRQTVDSALLVAPGDSLTAEYRTILTNHPDSLKGAQELVKRSPTADNYVVLAENYCLAGEYQQCLDSAKKALEVRPNYPEAYNAVAAAYVSMGRLDDGIAAVRAALKIDPENRLAKENLANWQRGQLLAGEDIMRK